MGSEGCEMKLVLFIALLAGCAAAQGVINRAPPKTFRQANPFAGEDRAQRAGAKLFARECAQCHGAAGSGGKYAPTLAQLEVSQAPPGALFWVLKNGSLWRGMPSFAHLPESQRWQIVAYLQRRQQ